MNTRYKITDSYRDGNSFYCKLFNMNLFFNYLFFLSCT
jgi:hypothetical protein